MRLLVNCKTRDATLALWLCDEIVLSLESLRAGIARGLQLRSGGCHTSPPRFAYNPAMRAFEDRPKRETKA